MNDDFSPIILRSGALSASVCRHGAHVTAFGEEGQPPILFLSKESLFAPGKAIRGGVPVIAPWFGPLEGHPQAPSHGLVRTIPWEVGDLSENAAIFKTRLPASADWPGTGDAELTVKVEGGLHLALTVRNTGSEVARWETAFHPYFTVSDITKVRILGLGGHGFFDKTDGFARKTQQEEALRIESETDRVYFDATGTCVIEDAGWSRRIVLEKSGSHSTIAWNPWIERSKALPDFGDEEWRGMVCVEQGNVGGNAVTLAPGASAVLEACYRTEAI